MIRPWTKADLPMLGRWLKTRGIAEDAGGEDLYPAVGFVADNLAVGFLYQTDAPAVAWLDGIVTDPESTREERARALGDVVSALYEAADRLGIKVVWSTTSVRSLVELGLAHGARVFQREHVCISRTRGE